TVGEDAAGEGEHVHVMEADGVDAEISETIGEGVGLFVGGESAAEADIDTPETETSVPGEEMSIAADNGSEMAGGCVEEESGGDSIGGGGVEGDGEVGEVIGGRGELGDGG